MHVQVIVVCRVQLYVNLAYAQARHCPNTASHTRVTETVDKATTIDCIGTAYVVNRAIIEIAQLTGDEEGRRKMVDEDENGLDLGLFLAPRRKVLWDDEGR
ncbi:hypothetical protein ACMFMG_000930 [Clarireedia jacksonii]